MQPEFRFVQHDHVGNVGLEKQRSQGHEPQRAVGKLMRSKKVLRTVPLMPVEQYPVGIGGLRAQAEAAERREHQTNGVLDLAVALDVIVLHSMQERRQVARVVTQVRIVFNVGAPTNVGAKGRVVKLVCIAVTKQPEQYAARPVARLRLLLQSGLGVAGTQQHAFDSFFCEPHRVGSRVHEAHLIRRSRLVHAAAAAEFDAGAHLRRRPGAEVQQRLGPAFSADVLLQAVRAYEPQHSEEGDEVALPRPVGPEQDGDLVELDFALCERLEALDCDPIQLRSGTAGWALDQPSVARVVHEVPPSASGAAPDSARITATQPTPVRAGS